MNPIAELIESLAVERVEIDLFRGFTPKGSGSHIYGGQVIAQCLLAAYETVEGRICHSLHCHFLQSGDPYTPILFDVERARDGGTFVTRRVAAIQHDREIFSLTASFQTPEDGLEHRSAMPPAPDPETIPRSGPGGAPQGADAAERPIDIRYVQGPFEAEARPEARAELWMRARGEIGDDPRRQQAVMAFASDLALLNTSLVPHPVNWATPGLQRASLDHAIWFHRPTDFSRWHLISQESPSASGGRGFNRGEVYREDGMLVASMAQEGLIRVRSQMR